MVYSGAKRAYSQDKIIIQIMSNAILFYDLFYRCLFWTLLFSNRGHEFTTGGMELDFKN